MQYKVTFQYKVCSIKWLPNVKYAEYEVAAKLPFRRVQFGFVQFVFVSVICLANFRLQFVSSTVQ